MINLRNVRISLLYITNLIVLFSIIAFFVSYVDLSIIVQNSIKGAITFITFLTCITGFFLSLIYSIKYMYKAYKDYKVYKPNDYIIKWIYDREIWNTFIINNFKLNFLIEMKSVSKALKRCSIVSAIAILIFVVFDDRYKNHYKTILVVLLLAPIIYALSIILKMFISMLYNLIFTNQSITLNENYIIINEEIFPLNIPIEIELESKKIRNGNIEIKYATISRSANRYANMRYLIDKDIHILVIPIPKDKISEAKIYINK